MSLTRPSSPPSAPKVQEQPRILVSRRRRFWRICIIVLLLIAVVAAWEFLNNLTNRTDPAVAGRPLSNPHTHLHTVAFGEQPNVLYLGTHFGLFKSTDGGEHWPQLRGSLDTMMITSIAVSPSNQRTVAVIALPVSGIGQQAGVYFSADGGTTFQANSPAGLPLSAYPYTIRAGSASEGHFYAFYLYAGWFETHDMGRHWRLLNGGTLASMLTPSLLTDPLDAKHLLLGGDQGLFESKDDGASWKQLTAVQGNVFSLVASTTAPRHIFCATDQGLYQWREGSGQIVPVSLPEGIHLTRLVIDATGTLLYGMSGQNLWSSADSGATWQQRFHFERDDLVSLLIDPAHPQHLYVGFFLPAALLESTDGGGSWHTATN